MKIHADLLDVQHLIKVLIESLSLKYHKCITHMREIILYSQFDRLYLFLMIQYYSYMQNHYINVSNRYSLKSNHFGQLYILKKESLICNILEYFQ